MLTEVLSPNPTEDTLKEVCDRLKAQAGMDCYFDKFIIKFSRPTTILKHGRYVNDITEMKVRTFFSKQKNYCYTFGSRTGYPFSRITMSNIQSISIPTKDEDESQKVLHYLNKVRHALKILHPNAWDNLRSELVEDPAQYRHYGGFLKIFVPKKYTSIRGDTDCVLYKSVFPDYVRELVIEGFENKKNFSHYIYRNHYRFAVEGTLGNDGIFRAWYSREVEGGGNSWSYLLLNPTTAWFVEKD
jgi:hypothetical protein